MRHAWLAAVVLVGCGGSSKSAEAPAVAAPTCGSTAEHMVDFIASQQDPRPPDDAINPLIALIRTRCEEDRWSTEARQCLREMRSKQDADTCGTLLTEAQQAALVHDQQEKFGVLGDTTATKDRSDAPKGGDAEGGGGAAPGTARGDDGTQGSPAPPAGAPRMAPAPAPMADAPPAPPPPAPRKKSRAPAKAADPCDGGE